MPEASRTALVTGAGSGIGRAVCLQLAREGVNVACADLNKDAAETTAAAISQSGRESLSIAVDVTNRAQVQAMVDQAQSAWGRIDILVTCAGIFPRAFISELEETEWDRVVDVLLKGTFLCCQAVLPVMTAQRSGRIVLTASNLANAGMPRSAAYASAKGGVISFTRVLAREAEPHGITVNAFGPGITDTPMFRGSSPEEFDDAVRRAPFQHLATPEESAELAVWFTRSETAHVSGRIFT